MKQFLLFLSCILSFTLSEAQNTTQPTRYIEVVGSAELEVAPDEIKLIIRIEEYWKEEFEKNAEFKDYKTKVPITEIETNLINDLKKLGVSKESITVLEAGNYWRYKGKDFLMSKQFELTLKEFKKVDEIINNINTKGIDYVRINELKNKNISQYRQQVKAEALKAAKDKADYLLKSLNKQTGEVISIVEINNDNFWFAPPLSSMSNTAMAAPENSGIENFRKIKLRYEIKASFEIK